MQPSEKIRKYSNVVCEQIKWKRAHSAVREEIENHLADQRDSYITEGSDEAAATDKAIIQMGDPVTVGAELNRMHRPKPQLGMLILTASIVFIGLIIELFLVYKQENTWELLTFALAGLAIMAVVYFMDFSWIGRHPKITYLSMLILTVVMFITSLFNLPFSYFTFYVPLLFPLGFAGVVYSARNKGYRGIILCVAALFIPALMLLSLSEFGPGSILFTVSGIVILCIAISKGWFGVKIIRGYILLIPALIALLLMSTYTLQYIDKFTTQDEGQLSIQVKTILANSQLFGLGSDLPIDFQSWSGWGIAFTLTYMIFNVGWIPTILIIGILLLFIVMGFKKCIKQKSALALFISVSVMMTLTVQIVINIAANMGIFVSLASSTPLIMQHNYSYFFNIALIGLMLSVFRMEYVIKDSSIKAVRKHTLISS